MGGAQSLQERARLETSNAGHHVATITTENAEIKVIYAPGVSIYNSWKRAILMTNGQAIETMAFIKEIDYESKDIISMFDAIRNDDSLSFSVSRHVMMKIPDNYSDISTLKVMHLARHAGKVLPILFTVSWMA